MALSSPNRVPWQLFGMLERFACAPEAISPDVIQQNALSSIFIATATIEAFTNIFFRVVADEPVFSHARHTIIANLNDRRRSTAANLREWTNLAFGRQIDTDDRRWRAFDELRRLRNRLVHFRSTHETLTIDTATIVG